MNRKTEFIFRLKCIIKRCRERGLWDVAIGLHKKYNIPKINEDYYD
jgi:hypothetical protein